MTMFKFESCVSFGLMATVLAAGLLMPGVAGADRAWDEQPAVRNKLELRKLRFEVAPTFDMSIAADYKNTYSAGLKGEFHLTDTLSLGGQIFAGTSTKTGLAGQVSDSLPPTMVATEPTPSRDTFENAINSTPLHGGAGVTFTPLFGKISLFGATYLNFDIYFKGGLGFGQLTNDHNSTGECGPVADGTVTGPDGMPALDGEGQPIPAFNDPRNDCPDNTGTQLGLMAGGGIHFYLNRWIALDISIHDYIYSDNPRGGDFDGDGRIDGDDRRFMGHLFFGLGLSLYLPTTVDRSR